MSRGRRVARYQLLEDRRLLAGDVRVVENVHLFIRGDAADNQFEIVVEDSQLMINGLDGTTINGKESVAIAGAKVTDSGVTFAGGLRAHLGPGNDDFTLKGAQFESMSLLYGGTGDDTIDVFDSNFKDQFTIQTYDGDDSVSTTRSHFEDTFRALTLDGEDSITMVDSMMAGNSLVVTGNHSDSIHSQGNHYMGELNLVLPLDGDDTVQLNDPVVGEHRLGVFLGDGDDVINGNLMEAVVEGSIRIGGQGGVDQAGQMLMNDEASESTSMATIEHMQVFDGGVGGASMVELGIGSMVNEDTNNGDRYATPIVLDATASVTSVEWTGSYERDVFNFDLPEVADRFVVEIYEDAGDGAPDTSSLVQYEVGGANRTDSGEVRQVFTSGQLDYEYPIYDFSAEVEYTMEAGKQYWVSIYVVLEGEPSVFGPHAGAWQWGSQWDNSTIETLHRSTWTADSATTGEGGWRYGGEGDRKPSIFPGPDMDIRLRT
jgi:hypothetical protein